MRGHNRGWRETDVLESAMQCLMFAGRGEGDAQGMIALLGERGFSVTQCAELRECLNLLCRRPWRLAVFDASGAADSLEVLAQAREACPRIPALILVREGDVRTAVQAMKAGATDCLETPVRPARLLAAVAPFSEHPDRPSGEPCMGLTRVEQVVLGHILDGRTNRQIADALCRSPRTVEVHRRHVMTKLRAANLIDLVRQAMRAGMLDCPGSHCRYGPEVCRELTDHFTKDVNR